MPELPEVETTRRGLLPWLQGTSISDVIIRQRQLRWPTPRNLKNLLMGQTVINIRRRGKYLLFDFETGHMLVHLGMSGSLRIVDDSAEIRKHDHIDWRLDSGKILRFHDPRRFGSVHWIKQNPLEHSLLSDLGPEPLENEFTGDYLFTRSRKRKTAAKSFIMNSAIVVGVGNIYASESLFLAGIHPRKAAGKVSLERYIKLADAIKAVLNASIMEGGTTLRDFVNESGNPGYFRQQLRVYEREGESCLLCESKIKRVVIGQRASYFCGQCQS
jgi:formamidopyrimidine-DNA glycosylase